MQMKIQEKKLTGYFCAKKMRFSNDINPPPLQIMVRWFMLAHSKFQKTGTVDCIKNS